MFFRSDFLIRQPTPVASTMSIECVAGGNNNFVLNAFFCWDMYVGAQEEWIHLHCHLKGTLDSNPICWTYRFGPMFKATAIMIRPAGEVLGARVGSFWVLFWVWVYLDHRMQKHFLVDSEMLAGVYESMLAERWFCLVYEPHSDHSPKNCPMKWLHGFFFGQAGAVQ